MDDRTIMAIELKSQDSVSGMLIRGGTSKGLFIKASELPPAGPARDNIILELFGSPDPFQLDGVGGAHVNTSKVAIVTGSSRANVDIEYKMGQVGIANQKIDYSGNCGNLTSAIGVFGLLTGLVSPTEPDTVISLLNTNTDARIVQMVPIHEGEPAVSGDYSIDGVPGTGARIDSRFQSPGGEVLDGNILPTGSPTDHVRIDGSTYRVSVLDAVTLCVFVKASDLGLVGSEIHTELQKRRSLLQLLERIRGNILKELGLVDHAEDSRTERPGTPLIGIVDKPKSYKTSEGSKVSVNDIDLVSSMISSQSPHPAYPVTGALCLAAASTLEETVPHSAICPPHTSDSVTIGHPNGMITVDIEMADGSTGSVGNRRITDLNIGRTARLIMSGDVYHHETRVD